MFRLRRPERVSRFGRPESTLRELIACQLASGAVWPTCLGGASKVARNSHLTCTTRSGQADQARRNLEGLDAVVRLEDVGWLLAVEALPVSKLPKAHKLSVEVLKDIFLFATVLDQKGNQRQCKPWFSFSAGARSLTINSYFRKRRKTKPTMLQHLWRNLRSAGTPAAPAPTPAFDPFAGMATGQAPAQGPSALSFHQAVAGAGFGNLAMTGRDSVMSLL